MFKITKDETSPKNKITYKTFKYYFKIFIKEMPHPPFHMEKEGLVKIERL
jgi:hypothetical protein